MRPLARSWIAHVMAMLAVALLAFASVKSSVMQAEMALPWANAPMCGEMAGHEPSGDSHEHHQALEFCAACAAAAHAPIVAPLELLRAPVLVAWRVAPPGEHRTPRDFRLERPNARGPPQLSLAA